jgi:hypothetical protein
MNKILGLTNALGSPATAAAAKETTTTTKTTSKKLTEKILQYHGHEWFDHLQQ